MMFDWLENGYGDPMTGLLVLAIVIVLIWIEVIMFGIVGGAIGVLPTVIGVFISAILGFQLIRFHMMRLVATDAFGILCFVPGLNLLIGQILFRLFPAAKSRPFPFPQNGFGMPPSFHKKDDEQEQKSSDMIIEGEAEHIDPDKRE
jgi:UPF0716 family protein affecting phage T7 exclusion